MAYQDYETQAQKQKDGTYILKHKETGEPIAILTPSYRYGSARAVEGSWHPDFKLTHPEIEDNILQRNLSGGNMSRHLNRFDSLEHAKNRIGHLAKQFKTGNYDKDPVKVKYTGEEQIGDEKFHKFDLHDDDGEKFGHFHTKDSPDKIHPDSDVKAHWDDEYRSRSNISDTTKEAAKNKFPGTGLNSTLNRARYLLDNKDKEPRFIGTQQSVRASTNVYKTKLQPEEASKAYEDALRKSKGEEYQFTRHSPTAFTMHRPAGSVHDSSENHTITSFPGELHHTAYVLDHPDYQYGKKNTNIVESV